ncbi:MAG TPA: acyl-CoA reductase [Gemmatimonadota bacterium]|nr:acyl-CoA reductase [Gemmatimonadota bacterium]
MTGPVEVGERVRALVAAGERLRARRLEEVLEVVAEACRLWRGPGPDREAGEHALAAHYGVPRPAIAEILDAGFGSWTVGSLRDWVAGELGDPTVMDGFVPIGGAERRTFGPRLAVFLAAHGVPTSPVADLISALCVKSSAWLKPATGADDLARRFVRTLSEIDAGIAAALLVEEWGKGEADGELILGAADVLVATGGAETMLAIQRKVSVETRLVLHGPRTSAAIVLREALDADSGAVIAALARDTAFAGQMGCLSPVVAYVEASPRQVADLVEPLHAACVQRWPSAPRAQATLAERAAFAEWRSTAGVEAASERGSWRGDVDSAWTVVARRKAGPPDPPPVPRMLTLNPLEDIVDAVDLLAARRDTIAAVGMSGPADRVTDLAGSLAEVGVERICPLGRMQCPPAAWRRDGRTTLTDLVRWVDRESGR